MAWGGYFYLLVLFGSDFVNWIFVKKFQTFLEVKIDINWVNLTLCQAHWVLLKISLGGARDEYFSCFLLWQQPYESFWKWWQFWDKHFSLSTIFETLYAQILSPWNYIFSHNTIISSEYVNLWQKNLTNFGPPLMKIHDWATY